MDKFKKDPIKQEDLIEYLDSSSDFAFELQCLEKLSDLGFQCQHGGSYTDPITEKTRQFDIRAWKTQEHICIRSAVECKNLADFHLLVSCRPRTCDESFHDLIFSYHPNMIKQSIPRFPAFDKKWKHYRIEFPNSNYKEGDPVGKNLDQLGRSNNNSITSKNSEVYEKWSQALASVDDLIAEAIQEGENKNKFFSTLILPVLVVPDEKLWKVDLSSNGTRISDPVKTNRCSYYVGKCYYPDSFSDESLVLSHLEIVTFSGLIELMQDILVPNNLWFPSHDGK